MKSLSIDIGASGGKILVADIISGKLVIDEIYHFTNRMETRDGSLIWNVDNLFDEIVKGLKIAKQKGIDECSVGICTWGVDYVLIDQNGNLIDKVYAYRDLRTMNSIKKVSKKIRLEEIYQKTGIQFLPFNTLYQLFEHDKTILEKAYKILLLPDWIYFKLTGQLINEITNMSTSQLLNISTKEFDPDLLNLIGVKRKQFCDLVEPGLIIDSTNPAYANDSFPKMTFIVAPTHDTASAVIGMPLNQKRAFLSTGTWGLIGAEINDISKNNVKIDNTFTNEYGAFNSIRYLKNIIGLWFTQEIKRNLSNKFSYEDLVEEARKSYSFEYLINCNDSRFLAPENMLYEIMNYLKETSQSIPSDISGISRCIIDSLALYIGKSIFELEKNINTQFESLVVVGGGVKNPLLLQTIANVSGKEIYAGFDETTSLGNIIVQKIALKELADLPQARNLIEQQINPKIYYPNGEQYINEYNKLSLLENHH